MTKPKYRFRVSRFLKRDLVVRVNSLGSDGIVRSARKLFEFHPNGNTKDEGWYETTDQVLIESIKDLKETLPYSKSTELGLIQDEIEFDYSYCASCGNSRVKKIQYNMFEVTPVPEEKPKRGRAKSQVAKDMEKQP